MENWKMTCYIPCHGSNLFKIKSICSFHTLCSTSLLQSTVDYSTTWKTGCTCNKLIAYFVVNCVKIFWNTTSIYSLSVLCRSLSLSRTDFLVLHVDQENPVSFLHKTHCSRALKWQSLGKWYPSLHKAFLSLPKSSANACLPPVHRTPQKTSWLSWFCLWFSHLNFKWSLLLFRKELSSMQ